MEICIVGATGLVGRQMLVEISEFADVNITLFASSRSAGKVIEQGEESYTVLELNRNIDFSKYQIAIFSAGKRISLEYAPLFAEAGCYVVDNSSAFRRDEDKALLTMGVNLEDIGKYNSKIIANPNCSTIQSLIAINQISKQYNIVDIDYVTYQSVSGSGAAGIRDLKLTSQGLDPENYDYPIANNLIPQIDVMIENGNSFEEEKMIFETQKILGIESDITATCVRVPLSSGHTVQIRLELDEEVNEEEIIGLLNKQDHLRVLEEELPMPLNVHGQRHVDVGRVRVNSNNPRVVRLMCVADNLCVGAATNACQIAKYLMEKEIV